VWLHPLHLRKQTFSTHYEKNIGKTDRFVSLLSLDHWRIVFDDRRLFICRRTSAVARQIKIIPESEGAVAVEFAIILPLLLFLVLGGMDIAHMFYIDHLITTASRDGARYGAKYTGYPPNDPTDTQIRNYAISTIPPLENLQVASLYSVVGLDRIVTVTVTADKAWWVLGNLTLFRQFGFQGFTDPQTRRATTAMKVER
jgi:Flp pilus assembly protein TadG